MDKQFDTIIFCDFDGTITTEETFVGSFLQVSRQEDLVHWFGKLQNHEITLRECTETLFSLVPSERYAKIEAYAETAQIREGFGDFLDAAAAHGCGVVVISGGIRTMQEKILAPYLSRITDFYSCDLDVSGPYMKFSSQYASEEENMSKEKIMALYTYRQAICIGDSITDIRMSQHADVVFARDGLKAYLEEQGKPYHPWETFYDIIKALEWDA